MEKTQQNNNMSTPNLLIIYLEGIYKISWYYKVSIFEPPKTLILIFSEPLACTNYQIRDMKISP